MKFKSSPLKIIIFTVVAVLLGVGIYFSFPKILGVIGFIVKLFLPFILGYGFSVLVNPLVDFLQRRLKIPRGLSTIIVIVLTIGIIGGIITGIVYKFVDEARNLYSQFPLIYANFQDSMKTISDKWQTIYVSLPESIQNAANNLLKGIQDSVSGFINTHSTPMVSYAGNFAKSLPNIFISSIVFILSSFFMVSDAKTVKRTVHKMLSPKAVDRFDSIKKEIHKYLGGYVRAQLIIMTIASVIIFTGLSILKIEYALIIAVLIALIDALPFFGSGCILWPWAAVSFINSDIKLGVGLMIIYFAVIFTRQMIEPKIVSQNIGMHPLITLMSMYVGYRTLSIGGMILGPIIMMLVISFYKAGVFDGLIRFIKSALAFFRGELRNIKELLMAQFGGKNSD